MQMTPETTNSPTPTNQSPVPFRPAAAAIATGAQPDNVPSYRTALREILVERTRRNPAYSLRAMADQLKISPSTLSEVLKGKKNFSREMGFKVAGRLKLPRQEAEYFQLLIEYETAKNPDLKAAVLIKLKGLQPGLEYMDFSADRFKMISEWYHFAIVSMTSLDNVDLSPTGIAKRLRITPFEVESAIERLTRLGLLVPCEKRGIKRSVNSLQVVIDAPDHAMSNYQKQVFGKAIDSIEGQSMDERFFSTQSIAINTKDMPEFKRLTREFVSRVISLARQQPEKDQVYNLGVLFYKVT